MRKAALLYNPLSGRRVKHRVADVEAVLATLRAAGVEAIAEATVSAKGTTEQARRAIAEGCDTIFACGGDGTIHDVLQALVGTAVVLGVIPLGTANALAHDLRIPLSAVPAAHTALASQTRRLAVGRVVFQDFSGQNDSRYFTVTAGVGVDAHLFYKLNAMTKGRFGMLAYYLKATHLWLTHDMRTFNVGVCSTADAATSKTDQVQWQQVSQLLAVRINQFGGILRELAPGASLERTTLRLVSFKTRNRLIYLAYILRGLFGQRWTVRGIELADAQHAVCETLAERGARIFVEADGELLGTLPVEITIIPDAFTLLMPPQG